jgi:hypothetical protein
VYPSNLPRKASLIAVASCLVILTPHELMARNVPSLATGLIQPGPLSRTKHESLAQVNAQIILEAAKLAYQMYKDSRSKSDVPQKYTTLPPSQVGSIQDPGFSPQFFPNPSQVVAISEWVNVAPGMNAAKNNVEGWSYYDASTGMPYGFSSREKTSGQLHYFYPSGLRFQ